MIEFIPTFLRTRAYVLIALMFTLTALIVLLTRESLDREWMWRWNQVSIAHVEGVYAALIVVLLLMLPIAPRLLTFLRRNRRFILPIAPLASFVSMSLLEPNQEHRLFITPFSIWVIIAHVLALATLLVVVTTQTDEPSTGGSVGRRVLLLLLFFLIVLHVISLGQFMPVDMPDEPWLGSVATNYAENHDLSPSFIGSPYGSPDPVLSRYYFLMGLWVRAVGSSPESLRAFPLLVLAGSALLVGYILSRHPDHTLTQLLFGMIIFLSLSPVMRMSHNLRPDIGLGIYGALMLWGMMQIFSQEKLRSSWALWLGFSLYLGLETIPFVALALAVVTGILLIIWLLRHRTLRSNWLPVVVYALSCGLMLLLYVGVRFLPDVQAALHGYQQFNRTYTGETELGTLRLPFDSLWNYHLRFSLILSPMECLVILFVLAVLWRQGTTAERWTLLSFAGALVLLLFTTRFSFGYWVIFAPLIAYAVVRALRFPRIRTIGSLVALPAMLAVPVYDFAAAVQFQPNQTRLQAAYTLAPLIPSEITIIGDDAFWFTLHSNRRFIGVSGFWVYFSSYDGSVEEAIRTLGADLILCREGDDGCTRLVEAAHFEHSSAHIVGDEVYTIHWQTEASAPLSP